MNVNKLLWLLYFLSIQPIKAMQHPPIQCGFPEPNDFELDLVGDTIQSKPLVCLGIVVGRQYEFYPVRVFSNGIGMTQSEVPSKTTYELFLSTKIALSISVAGLSLGAYYWYKSYK